MFDRSRTLYANVVGCVLMGLLSRGKGWLVANHYALHVGLGVGVGGSVTSFSSWQLEASHALFGIGSAGTGGQRVMEFVGIQVASPVASPARAGRAGKGDGHRRAPAALRACCCCFARARPRVILHDRVLYVRSTRLEHVHVIFGSIKKSSKI